MSEKEVSEVAAWTRKLYQEDQSCFAFLSFYFHISIINGLKLKNYIEVQNEFMGRL
jgi:hypothetical protein